MSETAASEPPKTKNKSGDGGGGGCPPPNIQPKPKLSKAERRALQEQQRAAKAARQAGGGAADHKGSNNDNNVQSKMNPEKKFPHEDTTATASTKTTPSVESNNDNKEVKADDDSHCLPGQITAAAATTVTKNALVSHLTPLPPADQIFETGAALRCCTSSANKENQTYPSSLHPAVLRLGYRYATGSIRGGNARCRAMLTCLAGLLGEYSFAPPSVPSATTSTTTVAVVDYRTVMEQQVLKPAFQFWTEQCRPHSVSMGNAFTFLKAAVAALNRDLPWEVAVQTLQETVASYIRERIEYADRAIAETVCGKILNKDEVILTYGHSEAVAAVLLEAAHRNSIDTRECNLRVIVVDSPPLCEGRIMLQKLSKAGVECTYIPIAAVTYVMPVEVTKVVLGAAALMSDGSVTGRVGTAAIASAAAAFHKPVLVCAETYKISNRVHLESLTSNEVLNTVSAEGSNNASGVKVLNLLFDLTPASFVSGIVTEFGIVPPTSVAVLLREMNPQEIKSLHR
jgi:translation initiation factor eIF-2B subunit delta